MLEPMIATRNGFLAAAWGMLGLTALLCLAIVHHEGLRLVTPGPLAFLPVAITFTVAQAYTWLDRDARIVVALDTTTYLMCATLVLILASYVAATAGAPLRDDAMGIFDRALGFDWQAHFAWLAAHPPLMLALGWIYDTSLVQPLAIILVLAFTGQLPRLQLFLLLYVAGALAVIAVSAFVPTAGAFHQYLGGRPVAALVYGHVVGPDHLAQYFGLRDGSLRVIDLLQAKGMISFPSFHTVLSVLYIWALARTPWLRGPAVVLNLLIILSTLSIGGHYLADVVGGTVIALALIAAATRLTQLAGARYRVKAAPVPAALAPAG